MKIVFDSPVDLKGIMMHTRISFEVDGKWETSLPITATKSLGCDGIVRTGNERSNTPIVSVTGTLRDAETLQRIAKKNGLELGIDCKESFQSQQWLNTPKFIGV